MQQPIILHNQLTAQRFKVLFSVYCALKIESALYLVLYLETKNR